MNMFSGYGSDSEGENVAAVSPPEIPKPVVTNSSKPSQDVQRKVKRLDISFLPPEIQAALTRGDSTNDSDDDGPGYIAGQRNGSSAGPTKTGETGTKSKLLGLLPAPKGKEEPKLESKAAQETKLAEQIALKQPVSPPKSKFVFGYASTSTSRVSAKPNDVAQQKAVADPAPSSDNEEDAPVLPWLQSSSSKSSSVTQERVTPFASAPPPPKPSPAPFAPPVVAASLPAAFPPTPAQSSAPAQPQQLSYEEYMRQQALLQQQHGYYGPSADEAQSSAGRKRKDREIELQLLAGDLSGLDQQAGAVKEITVDHDWNEFAYTEQQQRQLEVQRGFGLGTNKMLTQVSKQQNRKHQLSSLAIKAAETELALLEKRGARNLTKTETQGKYGW